MLTSSRGPRPPSSRMRRVYAVVWSCLALAQWALFATARHDRPTFLAASVILTVGALASIARTRRGAAATPTC